MFDRHWANSCQVPPKFADIGPLCAKSVHGSRRSLGHVKRIRRLQHTTTDPIPRIKWARPHMCGKRAGNLAPMRGARLHPNEQLARATSVFLQAARRVTSLGGGGHKTEMSRAVEPPTQWVEHDSHVVLRPMSVTRPTNRNRQLLVRIHIAQNDEP